MYKKLLCLFLLLYCICAKAQIKTYTDLYASPSNIPAEIIIPYIDSLLNADQLSNFWCDSDFNIWGNSLLSEIPLYAFKTYPEQYTVSLLGIIDLQDKNTFKITLGFFYNADSVSNGLLFVLNIVAKIDSNKKVRFSNFTNEIIKHWYTTKIGNITFYKEDKRLFNAHDARKMNQANDSLSKFFKRPTVKNIVYISCIDPFQLFKVKGYYFILNSYYAKSGAIVNYGYKGSKFERIIYSANNKEIYTHELVHFYTKQLVIDEKQTSRFADEGIATFLTGTSNISLQKHLSDLSNYIKKVKPDYKIIIANNSEKSVNNVEDIYLIGGLVAKMIYDKKGLNGLIDMLNVSIDDLPNKIGKILEVPAEDLSNILMAELKKY